MIKPPKEQFNSVKKIVDSGRCTGCGVCAVVPGKPCKISMRFNRNGDYVPFVRGCHNCGLCMSVCPGVSRYNGTKIHPLQNVLAAYVGYSNVDNEREHGSSGGLATRFLKVLLTNNLVDAVICAGQSKKESILFDINIANNVQEIEQCSGSKYYPFEYSQVLDEVFSTDKRFAVIGTPCVLEGISRLRQKSDLLKQRIPYLLGLTCGHGVNRLYADFLIALSGETVASTKTVCFRKKSTQGKAVNYGFSVSNVLGRESKPLNFLSSCIHKLWCNYFFSKNSCLFCGDLFSEYADITFMDAWIKPYSDNPRGTSIVCVRSRSCNEVFKKEIQTGNIHGEIIQLSKVIDSQECALEIKSSCQRKKLAFKINRLVSNQVYLLFGNSRNVLITIKFYASCVQILKLKKLKAIMQLKIFLRRLILL